MLQLKERSARAHNLLVVFKPKARASHIDHDYEHHYHKTITVFDLEHFDCTLESTIPLVCRPQREKEALELMANSYVGHL